MAISTRISRQQEYDYYLRKKYEEEYMRQRDAMYYDQVQDAIFPKKQKLAVEDTKLPNKETDILLLLEDLA